MKVNLDGCKYQKLGPEDAGMVVSFINKIQPNIPWSVQMYNWQFYETPGGAANLYGIMNNNGELISFYASVAHLLRVGNKSCTARMVQDVMTRPDYRGRGFLHYLGEKCAQDIFNNKEVGYTFPNEKSHNSFIRVGWNELGKVPLREKKIIELNANNDQNMCEFTKIEKYYDEISDDIWGNTKLSTGVQRDSKYLNWRYNKPGESYIKYLINDTEGVLILKIYDDNKLCILHICDLFVIEGKEHLIPEVLGFVHNIGVANGADMISAWLANRHEYSGYFDDFGLKLLGNITRTIFSHTKSHIENDIEKICSWHITHGDSDVY